MVINHEHRGDEMTTKEDWKHIVGKLGRSQYEDRIKSLKENGINTTFIEETIRKTIKSFTYGDNSSFVIFGEPQSGKTEMMIALNAKLLDEGCEVIINLVTDSVDLLQQNISRFRNAGLSPSPKQFSELPIEAKEMTGKQWVIFSKKNARDLEKLIEILRFIQKVVIIDDEADYASPNAKINRGEKTKINELIHSLLSTRGKYIGVTATPARLDLNNTFENDTELWVEFDPHPLYVGQEFFSPTNGRIEYRLHTFDGTQGNEKLEIRNAVFHFLCGVAEQHQSGNEANFTMIVHTSGNTIEHGEDHRMVEKTISVLSNPNDRLFNSYTSQLEKIAEGYSSIDASSIVEFILRNINRNQIIEINSKKKNLNIADILTPKSLFSFGVGGNIISRGVTFENLLSMYFTRSVKGKMSQDTYIQRARMFGNRSTYKNTFQLWITDTLLSDWAKCFIFHRLAIQSARSGMGAPVWLSDFKTTPTSASSIDRSTVDFEDGEMSFALFDLESKSVDGIFESSKLSSNEKLLEAKKVLGDKCFPDYIYSFLSNELQASEDICFHKSSRFGTEKSNYDQEDIDLIRRKRGIFSTNEFLRGDKPNAKHHLKVFYNYKGLARLFYKINGRSIKFMQNKK
jgi:hypothetical protein